MNRLRRALAAAVLGVSLACLPAVSMAALPDLDVPIIDTPIIIPGLLRTAPADAPTIGPRWTYAGLKGFHYAPSIGPDGTVYVGSWNKYDPGDGLAAVGSNGKAKWTLPDDSGYFDTAVGPDGILYAASYGDGLQAIAPDGTVRWTLDKNVLFQPKFGPDGTIVAGTGAGELLFVDPDDGSYRTSTVPNLVQTSLVVAPDGTVYAVGRDSVLHAVKPDGSSKWQRKMSDLTKDIGVALAADGTVYAASSLHTVQAYKPNGDPSVKTAVPARITATPAVDGNGTVFVGLEDGTLYAFTSSLAEKWKVAFGHRIDMTAVGPNGQLYVFSNDRLYALAVGDGDALWQASLPYSSSGNMFVQRVAFAPDGTLFVSGNRSLVAIGTPAVSSVALNRTALELQAGARATLTAAVIPAEAVNRKVTWSSSNPAIVNVDGSGNVTGVSAGQAKVFATTDEGGFIAACEVTVTPGPAVAFGDIAGHWAEPEIRKAVESGIVRGYEDGTFRPDHRVTRAEFALMIVRALKPDVEGAALTFKDADRIPSWAAQAVAQAVKLDIVRGNADGTFKPANPITHQEMLAMVVRASGKPIPDPAPATGYADDADISGWAKGAAYVAYQHSLLGGVADNRMRPQAPSTRAESAAAIVRMLDG